MNTELSAILNTCIDKNYRLLYATVTGSHLYGLNREGSDVDVKFVYVANPDSYIGLEPLDQSLAINSEIFGYELTNYIKLCLACNPTTLEMLYPAEEHVLFLNKSFQQVLDNKKYFLIDQVYQSHIKYAENQIKKSEKTTKEVVDELSDLESRLQQNGISLNNLSLPQNQRDLKDVTSDSGTVGDLISYYSKFITVRFPHSNLGEKRRKLIQTYGFDTKNISHCIRLMYSCLDIFQHKKVIPNRPENRQLLLDIKDGKISKDEYLAIYESLKKQIDFYREKQPLPKIADFSRFNKITQDLIYGVLRSKL